MLNSLSHPDALQSNHFNHKIFKCCILLCRVFAKFHIPIASAFSKSLQRGISSAYHSGPLSLFYDWNPLQVSHMCFTSFVRLSKASLDSFPPNRIQAEDMGHLLVFFSPFVTPIGKYSEGKSGSVAADGILLPVKFGLLRL